MPFKPARWLYNGHLQTLYPALFRQLPPVTSYRERWITPDQDFIDIDFCGNLTHCLVILLHGLTGSSQSLYIRGMQAALLNQGVSSAALNFRGCSGESNNTSRCYHSGETTDIDFVYMQLRNKYPKLPIAVVGFSLGGNVLLKWLGEKGPKLDLFAAVAVSVPLVLNECANRLDMGFSKFYRNRLLTELKQYLQHKHQHLLNIQQFEEANKIRQLGNLTDIQSFWEYDERVVAPLYGFKNASDYYQKSSSRQYLSYIQVPSLIIQAADDPFMTPAVLPDADELSALVRMEVTVSGGHVGFVSGINPRKPGYWLEQRIPEFLKLQLQK
ncbi:hydrolase [Methylomonas sp. AM2-LC]|uniref:hydrolase n=1 Tax=Methylomonas sp. AM2-LC TaxID=3153301 RepID=UPI0032668C12